MVLENLFLVKMAVLLVIGGGTPYEGDLGRRVNRCYL
jgi:hypothetical protein